MPGYDFGNRPEDKELLKIKRDYKVARPLKLSIVSTFYWMMCFTTYQRLAQIQSFCSTFLSINGQR